MAGTLDRPTDMPLARGILADALAAYDYLCMACEHRFEERRPMTASVDTALACPSCGSDRVRRQFSFLAGTASTGSSPHATGGCACGGACACGH